MRKLLIVLSTLAIIGLAEEVTEEPEPPVVGDVGPPLTDEEKEAGSNLEAKDPIDELGVDPLETGEYVEGDIIGTNSTNSTSVEEGSTTNSYRKWPNAKVPYLISSQFSSYERQVIAGAMKEFEDRSCVRFVEKTSAYSDYVYIMKGSGCYSYIGRQGGYQPLSLGNGCVYKYIAIHEMMHAIGFYHEQSRSDRDSYVNIYWGNIRSGYESNFYRQSSSTINHHGTGYDYKSVMHYRRTAFTKNGQPTITAKSNYNLVLGNTYGFTSNDINEVNTLYCGGSTICKDNYSSCTWWARYYCYGRFHVFMKANCPKACKFC